MSKQIFNSDKPNSFRLKPDQAELLNELFSNVSEVNKLSEAILFLAYGFSKNLQAAKEDTSPDTEQLKAKLAEAESNYQAAQKTIFEIVANPFHELQKEEYEAIKKWSDEVFTPGLQKLTGQQNLRLTGRHRLLMVLDYCMADPVAQVFTIVPDLTPEQREKIADLQFPRPGVVYQILQEFKTNTDEPAEVDTNQTEQTDTAGNGATEGAKVIALNTVSETPGATT